MIVVTHIYALDSVNANSEALRSYFVAHEGKKELKVDGAGNRYTADFGFLATQMTNEIDENVSMTS